MSSNNKSKITKRYSGDNEEKASGSPKSPTSPKKTTEKPSSPKTVSEKPTSPKPSSPKPTKKIGGTWGRPHSGECGGPLGVTLIMLTTPFVVVYFYLAIANFGGSLYAPIEKLFLTNEMSFSDFISLIPLPTIKGWKIYLGWVAFQALLFQFVPGIPKKGRRTPAGNILDYNINGWRCVIITFFGYIAGAYFGLFPGSFIYDNWGALLPVVQIFGVLLTFFNFIKAHLAPTNSDVKFSGNPIYDLFVGIELNPRIFGFDLKLFFNGRPGIVAWSIIDISCAYKQYELYGYVSASMILVIILHELYIWDFLWNEDWYLETVDIAHDHMGFYLCWGDVTWLPYMYTLQAFYLVINPVPLNALQIALVLALGFGGFYIFRAVNYQKEYFRATDGKANIWGKKPEFIEAVYYTEDGKVHKSKLLVSGFWGLSKHFNYIGDLMLSFAYCLACWFDHILPYFYIFFMTILLVHRVHRDNIRCSAKYGKSWDEYNRRVPWKIVPYIF